MVSPLARSNAGQWRTHIPRRNRKRSDGAFRVVRYVPAAIRVLATWSSFDNPSVGSDCGLARFIPALWPSLRQLRKDRAQDHQDYEQRIEVFLPCWPKCDCIHGNLLFLCKWGASRHQSNEKFRTQ